MTAEALWCVGVNTAQIRPAAMGDGVAVDTLFTAISRGTERLVLAGAVPLTEYERMRGPGMEGVFPFPVKYGYCNVGRVAEGTLAGQIVFALFPHQTHYRVPEAALMPLPEGLPPERAVLAANMETALTILWDSGAGAGDRIAVIGAGVVGCLVGALAARLPGAEVTLVDVNGARYPVATQMGCRFSFADAPPCDCDVVIHTSATADGLALALDIAGQDATIVEASWHGDAQVSLPLGGAFHSRRLRLVSSQVGTVPPSRQPRWTHARRLAKALDLLCDHSFDALISGESAFTDLPRDYARILDAPETLCHRIRY